MTTKLDENYEKPSKHKQWQERSENPVATRPMTKADIETHRRNLVLSYQCEDNEIRYEFKKITDQHDEDRDDCIWVIYKHKCVRHGRTIEVDVFSIKMPIPEDILRAAEAIERQKAEARRQQLRIEGPIEIATPPIQTPTPKSTARRRAQAKK